ncbi:MAG: hypothetical protein LC808_13250 [Actinobacteria bacterium]|nr:hypothetical protein [Actinomycetota bacterium]
MPPRKRTDGPTPVESVRHADKRLNIPTADAKDFISERAAYVEQVRYHRDPTLDPQLVWKGKDAADCDDLVADAPPIYIQEKIDPRVVIENLRRTAESPQDERRPRSARQSRLLLPSRQLVEPSNPRRLATSDGITSGKGGPPRPGPDDLPGPTLRHQVRLQLASLHPHTRRQGWKN